MDPLFTTKIKVTTTADLLKAINQRLANIPFIGPAMNIVGHHIVQPDSESDSNIDQFYSLVGSVTITALGYLIYAASRKARTPQQFRRSRQTKRGKVFKEYMGVFNRFSEDIIERGRILIESFDLNLDNPCKAALILWYFSQVYEIGVPPPLKEIALKGNVRPRNLARMYKKYSPMIEELDHMIDFPELPPKSTPNSPNIFDIFEPDLPPSPPDLSKYPSNPKPLPSSYELDDIIESVWEDDEIDD